jgi:hypothetical protein
MKHQVIIDMDSAIDALTLASALRLLSKHPNSLLSATASAAAIVLLSSANSIVAAEIPSVAAEIPRNVEVRHIRNN